MGWDAGSQEILRSIEPSIDGWSFSLVLKPPRLQRDFLSPHTAFWQVCMLPGDGYNYYNKLCTETFPVMRSSTACDELPTSGTSLRQLSLAWLLGLISCVSGFR